MPRVFRKYNELLKTHPYKINMIGSSLFFGAGDLVAQYLFPNHIDDDVDQPTEFHAARTVRAIIYGGFFFGPVSVKWHAKTLAFIRSPFVSSLRRAHMSPHRLSIHDNLFRLAVDSLFMPSLVWIPMYNTVMSVLALHHDPLAVAADKLRNNWWNVLKSGWTMWMPLQLFNLFFVPVHLRIVIANMWSIGWNCYLSYVHNTKGYGKGSGRLLEELVDIETADEEQTMVYA
ncbi:hypothetical protein METBISCDRAFT_14359 [Metschnikowia bicuspidata]|uniref:Protein SYM1 n=1 Tax=Metschnikowia bicuspidata TaxID=27322 RepID=A0A4P9ZEB4_9ASCO|nr:hypothetical protein METBISCDRAFT_14359 [Metschnikowia bicuspidata]